LLRGTIAEGKSGCQFAICAIAAASVNGSLETQKGGKVLKSPLPLPPFSPLSATAIEVARLMPMPFTTTSLTTLPCTLNALCFP
jgi:hypothetical protein